MGFLGEVLVTMLAALLGAWGGARAALARFKEERAFDQQLEWYKDTVRALLETEEALMAAAAGPSVQSEAGKERLVALNEAVSQVLKLAHEGWLFASKDSIHHLGRARRGAHRIASFAFDHDTVGNPIHYDSLARIFKVAAFRIAEDGREHLGLEELNLKTARLELEEQG